MKCRPVGGCFSQIEIKFHANFCVLVFILHSGTKEQSEIYAFDNFVCFLISGLLKKRNHLISRDGSKRENTWSGLGQLLFIAI